MKHPADIDAGDRVQARLDEQAALRRVATLVAEGTTAGELFAAVVNEAARALDLTTVVLGRYESNTTVRILASLNDATFTAGSSWKLDGPSVAASALETGRPSRIDDYSELPGSIAAGVRESRLGSTVGVPIVVDGAVWGVMATASTADHSLPSDVEVQLAQFTGLAATAIANAQARDDLRARADEQAALSRVATLVAEGADSSVVFDAVCEEAGRLVGATSVNLSHYTPDGFNVTMAGWSLRDADVPVGTRFPLTPDAIGSKITETRAPVRIETWEGATSELARLVRECGVRSSLGAPIVVEGVLWGALVAATDTEDRLPSGTELRLARFTGLIATAISNATAHSKLIASRARLVAAGDEARKRIDRDLHDGTQQRLLAIGLDVHRIKASVSAEDSDVRSGLERVSRDLESVLDDLRELSRGLHPQMLARRGLRPTLVALARRSPIPVDLDIELDERPPEQIETAVYYAVSEALTNAINHSNASAISVRITTDHPGSPVATGLDDTPGGMTLHVTIADDGGGGAGPARGSGLDRLMDRIVALGGRLSLESPLGRGTRVAIALPLTFRAEP